MTATENFRAIALDHAVRTTGGLATPEEVAKAAETYLAFLEGRTTTTEGATADPQVANTVHVHFTPEDTEREPGEAGRRKRLVQGIVRDLRRSWPHAAELIEAAYGEVR